MQVVITILLCFIIALGLFIVYAGMNKHGHQHPYPTGLVDVDTLYRDRLFSWWDYPSRYWHRYHDGGAYHSGHGHGHEHGHGQTQNHGTQIVFSQAPPPPAVAKSVDFAMPQVGDAHVNVMHREGATDMQNATSAQRANRLQSMSEQRRAQMRGITNTNVNAPSNLQQSATANMQQSRLNMPPPPITGAPNLSSMQQGDGLQMAKLQTQLRSNTGSPSENFTANENNADEAEEVEEVAGFTSNYTSNCGTYNCAE